MQRKIQKVYVDKEIFSSPITKEVLSHFLITPTIINDSKIVYDDVYDSFDPIARGKEILYLTENKGSFIRKCPGTRHYHCCGYKILHTGTYCTMDCSYCILQQYFHPPLLKYFVNHGDLFGALENEIFQAPEISRIGTGEYTDSLIWEPISSLTPQLVEKFGKQSRAVLELKTKTVQIDKLKGLSHNRKTILAWSLNTPRIIQSDERDTAPLKARLKAARTCQSWGYPIAFHFDPIVLYKGCENEYIQVIQDIFETISPENIAWISLGVFRFLPELKTILETRFFDSKITYGEFIPGMDGKMRYFKSLRIDVCKTIVSAIRKYINPKIIYFCMEDDEIWQESFGYTPKEYNGITTMLDQQAQKICQLRKP